LIKHIKTVEEVNLIAKTCSLIEIIQPDLKKISSDQPGHVCKKFFEHVKTTDQVDVTRIWTRWCKIHRSKVNKAHRLKSAQQWPETSDQTHQT